jgi:hypothetical protein
LKATTLLIFSQNLRTSRDSLLETLRRFTTSSCAVERREQAAVSREWGAGSREDWAVSNEQQRVEGREQKAKSREQRAESGKQKAESREQGAGRIEERAKSRCIQRERSRSSGRQGV